MDYEIRIAIAERELAHLKEMQKLEQTRMDAQDSRMDRFHQLHLEHVEEMAELRKIVSEIGTMLKAFIASMQGHKQNGKATE